MRRCGARAAGWLLLLPLLLAGCRREVPVSPAAGPGETSRPAASAPPPPAPERGETAAAVDLVVGSGASAGGAAVVPKSAFSVGERVAFVLRGGPGAPGEVELVWRDANDAELHRARSPLAPGQSVEASFTPAGGWAPGVYRLEALAGGEIVAEQRFEVAELGERSERPGV